MVSTIFSAKRRTEVAATRRLFVQRFPRCFRASGMAKLPLARTIYQDLRQALPEVRGRLLRDALHDYTTGRSYLSALIEGASRVDLDGWPVSVVSEAEARNARRQLRDLLTQFAPKEKNHVAHPAA